MTNKANDITSHLWLIQRQILIWLFIFFALYLLNQLIPVLIPFLSAIVFAYLANPIIDQLCKYKVISRTVAVIIVFSIFSCLMAILLLLLTPIIINQIASFIASLPEYTRWVQNTLIPLLQKKLNLFEFIDQKTLTDALNNSLTTLSKVVSSLLGSISSSSLAVANFAANLALMPILIFYFMRDWDIFIKNIHHLLPRRFEKKICQLANESNLMLASFLRGQLLVMIFLGGIYGIGLSIIGLKYGLLIGLISGLVSFIPYLGFSVGIVLATVATLFQFDEWHYLLLTWGIFGFGQMMESFLLTPKLVGDKLGMHPVAVIFALMAGANLFGFFGILLALPFCAVLMVLLAHAKAIYLQSPLYHKVQ